jgi:hypothetical protein
MCVISHAVIGMHTQIMAQAHTFLDRNALLLRASGEDAGEADYEMLAQAGIRKYGSRISPSHAYNCKLYTYTVATANLSMMLVCEQRREKQACIDIYTKCRLRFDFDLM